MNERVCEVCNEEASLYCGSDSAFLCWNCDARIHEANFLVARHTREVLCCNCKSFAGNQISGGIARPVIPICRSCSPENPSDDDSLSSSSLSACVSSTESCSTVPKKTRPAKIDSSSSVSEDEECNTRAARMITKGQKKEGEWRRENRESCAAEEILVNWSRKLGMNGNFVASLGWKTLEKLTVLLPFRVAMATSFWFGLRCWGEGSLASFQTLRKLEAISNVPGKVIVAAEAKLARALRQRKARRELEEGWAEC